MFNCVALVKILIKTIYGIKSGVDLSLVASDGCRSLFVLFAVRVLLFKRAPYLG